MGLQAFDVLLVEEVLAVGGVVGDDTGGLAVHQDLQLGNGLDIVDGEGQGIVLTGLHGVGGGEHHGGIVDHAAVQLHAVGHTIEEEGVDGVVGDVVHAVGLIAVAVILQILAVPAVELGGAAFQLIAAHAPPLQGSTVQSASSLAVWE